MDDRVPEVGEITKLIGRPAVLEQLGEELFECGAMALKLARILRGENPTPADLDATEDAFFEESLDVMNCILESIFRECENIGWANDQKMARWLKRIMDAQNKEENENGTEN